ncbi:TenA family transcriptional regulator [Thermoproteus tenax]|uniref:TenA family transcriptional activator n=1 Tax=Thermoproteus tenax (strain ATCC 35583 / DSM 2078 / JCM 9277 / NBRC 100435 / Kra 1) TaxID=768679 RepID=G4RN56_THETK|nr:TenA family transcriptional regulator [Thermoproteus tenax]CCC81000.1 TenA family transcriptional activator [Thermoproteus tenax Kra 1]
MARVIETLREELRPLNAAALEAAKRADAEALKAFVVNQLYIVPHDLKALSAAMAKASAPDEYAFVKGLIDGDYTALGALRDLAGELGVQLDWARLSPFAVAYTHFLSWLALHGSMGDLAVAMTVNLPVWGEACAILSAKARELGVRSTRFLDMFAGPYEQLTEAAEVIAQRYLDWGRYRFIARAIQTYECAFWQTVTRGDLSACASQRV